ncbi:hypothetical protein P280DRAFT_155501 [Massarina eburnea CBS 473.64]|uniref:Uncharacterized protein n=1 Tax=Massarina eburnea CBS 473.64 TaxID=1395130 RepID=A0A6A6RNZ5_9PLEO|nr:hypothetical protein P280DRAFT_155501 [Massarina eburnea CBS 473.64]
MKKLAIAKQTTNPSFILPTPLAGLTTPVLAFRSLRRTKACIRPSLMTFPIPSVTAADTIGFAWATRRKSSNAHQVPNALMRGRCDQPMKRLVLREESRQRLYPALGHRS